MMIRNPIKDRRKLTLLCITFIVSCLLCTVHSFVTTTGTRSSKRLSRQSTILIERSFDHKQQTLDFVTRDPSLYILTKEKTEYEVLDVVESQNNPILNESSELRIQKDDDDDTKIQQNIDVEDYYVFVVLGLVFIVGSLSSLDRVAMSVALVPMSEEMDFTDSIKGSISSLFSVGYGLGIVPSGLLLSSLSPRIIMAAGITMWSLGTIATPYSAVQANMSLLLTARALVGASESVVIPTIQRLLSSWVPSEKKSLAVAFVYTGFQTGTILAYSLSPYVIDKFGDWRDLFYLYGGLGFLFLIPWLSLARDSPQYLLNGNVMSFLDANDDDDTSKTNYNEKFEIEASSTSTFETAKQIVASAPWKEFVKSKGVWAMFLAHAANNWGLYNNLSWTPTFYAEQYNLNVKESALLLVIPSIAGAIGGLSAGSLADRVIQNLPSSSSSSSTLKTEMDGNIGIDYDEEQQQQQQQQRLHEEEVTRVRKIFQGIALFGPAICLACLSITMPDEPIYAQGLLTTAVFLQSFNAAGYGAANQEKAGKNWTGLLYSITSLPSVVVGTCGVYLTGKILDYTDQNWSIIFGLNSIMYILGATAFVLLYDSKKEFD